MNVAATGPGIITPKMPPPERFSDATQAIDRLTEI